MAYIEIPDEWIEAGKPTKEEIFQYIKNNQESFNTDIEALKQTSVVDIINTKVSGYVSEYDSVEINNRMPVFRAPVQVTITSVVLALLEASTSGTLSIDLEVSTDNGANWSSILTVPVDLTGLTPGSLSGGVSFINVAAQTLNQNDLLRINVQTVQVNQGEFDISIYGEVS